MKNNLIVDRSYHHSSITYRTLGLIFIYIGLGVFLLSLFLLSGIESFIAFSSFLLFSLPFFIISLYYKNRKVQWDLDKTSQKAIYTKISPHYEFLQEVKFSNVEYLIYHHYKRADSALSPKIYSLSFYTGKLKEPIIYYGLSEECKNLGIIIARFIEKPLYYHNGEWKEKIDLLVKV